MTKKVLLFAYDYPPYGWSGVQRTVKFVRYMPNFDWYPIVVAPQKRYSPVPIDNSFSQEIAHAVNIRTNSFMPEDLSLLGKKLWKIFKPILSSAGKSQNWFIEGLTWRLESLFFPDESVTWLPFAVKEGLRTVKTYKPEVIYATAPPYSTLISAWIVSKLSRVPLVVDLRDLWIENPARIVTGRLKKFIDKILERTVLSGSSAIITTTKSGADWLRRKYPQKANRIFTIYNGYDENDFAYHISKKQDTHSPQLVISHVGSLYGDRNPKPVLQGFAKFLKNRLSQSPDVLLKFVGEVSQFEDIFKAYRDLEAIEVKNAVDHQAAIKIMKESDILLLLVAEKHKMVIPGKVFEYLASTRPILGILPLDGEIAELIRNQKSGWLVDIRNQEGIVNTLNGIYEEWTTRKSFKDTNQDFIATFERRFLTSKLCEVFQIISSDRN